ncbi:unnamed protein product [Allacma fusca]|uniref:Uncharacterized protein n=1 Tax=Allacma fusca TaxID=39272 RepID=A0A8J2KSK4_9HEXA|nr:unnamed protein product [Allacma fusca]
MEHKFFSPVYFICQNLANAMAQLGNLKQGTDICFPHPEKQQGLKFYCIFANIDRMLRKLPDDTVEDLHVKFINLVYDELKKTKSGN